MPRPHHLFVRGHGKFYDNTQTEENPNRLIHPNDLHDNTVIVFYGPPGAAIVGGVADDTIFHTGGNGGFCAPVRLERREEEVYSTLPLVPPLWNNQPTTFDRRNGYQPVYPPRNEPLHYPMWGTNILANWTLSGDDELNYGGMRCGVYDEHGNLLLALGNGQEILLSDILARFQGPFGCILHWTACSSMYVHNLVFSQLDYTGYKVVYNQ